MPVSGRVFIVYFGFIVKDLCVILKALFMNAPLLKTDILILGAGIGGYETFRCLTKRLRRAGLKKTITIVDQNNYFTFTPLLHEAAAGSVEPDHCAIPLRELVYGTPHQFIKATVQKIKPEKKVVQTDVGDIEYGYCVVALGSGVNYYGTPGGEQWSYGVRTLPQVMRLRDNLINKMEAGDGVVNLVIVGGGFSGVEVAGQMSYLAGHDFKKVYRNKKMMVSLVEAGPTLVPQIPERARTKILKRLKKLGVTVHLNSKVKEVSEKLVTLDKGENLRSDFTVWCAGVGNMAPCFFEAAYCLQGKLPVTHCLNHAEFKELYAVGDIISGTNEGETTPYPPLGEAAHRQGEYVAEHLVATLRGKTIQSFYFKSKGMLMPIGDNYGILVREQLVVAGFWAWWLRRTVYLLFMPGWLRKLKIVIDWKLHLIGFSYILEIEK